MMGSSKGKSEIANENENENESESFIYSDFVYVNQTCQRHFDGYFRLASHFLPFGKQLIILCTLAVMKKERKRLVDDQ